MRTLKLSSEIKVYDAFLDLDADDQQLLQEAENALAGAYAPYSHFRVGAAIRLDDGTVVLGSNQENAAFPMCICAEQSVVANVQSNFIESRITALAITARKTHGTLATPVPPCGACRQMLFETEQRNEKPIRILLRGATGPVYVLASTRTLLPLAFDSRYLDK